MTVRRFVRFVLAGSILAFVWFALSALALRDPHAPVYCVIAFVLLLTLLAALTRVYPSDRR